MVLGRGSRGPGEARAKLMWPTAFPLAHRAALWTPHLVYGRLSLLGSMAVALLNPSIPATLTGERQNLSGNLSIGLDTLSASGWNCRQGWWVFPWLRAGLHLLLGGTSDTVPFAWEGSPKPFFYIRTDYCAKKLCNCSCRPILHLR